MKKIRKIVITPVMTVMLLIRAMVSAEGQFSGKGKIPDDGSIHSLGNGKMCIYEKGPDIVTAYTGPCSSPSFLTPEWMNDIQEESRAVRKPGTTIWTHTMLMGNTETGEMLDFVDAEIPCFVRNVQTKSRITFRVKLEKYVQVINNSSPLNVNRAVNGLLLIVPPGTTIYQTYVYPRLLYSLIMP